MIQPVVIAVGDFRLGLDVIGVVVPVNFFNKLRVAFSGLGLRHEKNVSASLAKEKPF